MTDAGDAWRWSVEASRLMAQRLVDLYEGMGSVPNRGVGGMGANLAQELRNAQADLERWVELSVEVFDRTFTIMRRVAETGVDGRSSTDAVTLRAFAGEDCFGEVWLHNLPEGRTAPVLVCPGLTTARGESIAAAHVRFSHDGERDGASTSRRVLVLLAVPASATPGVYHGSILCDASPETAIPVRLTVIPPETPSGE